MSTITVELYNKDNLEVLKELKNESIDAYIFDPLFNSNRIYLSNPNDSGDVSRMNDVWKGGTASYLNDLNERFKQMYRTLSQRGLIVCHSDNTMGFDIRNLLIENGFTYRCVVKWSYSGGGIPSNNLPSKCDYIWVFMKSKDKKQWVYNPIMRQYANSTKKVGKHSTYIPNNVIDLDSGTPLTDTWDSRCEELERENAKRESWGWVFQPDFGSIKPVTGWAVPKGNTEKPIGLYFRLIYIFTNDDYSIVDPYMGSGTTIVAANGLNRSVIGIDYESEAYKRVKSRLKIGSISYIESEIKAPINDIDPNTMDAYEWERYYVILVGGVPTIRSGDGGVDGVRSADNTFIECKKHKNPVGVSYIRKFKTSIDIEGSERGWVNSKGLYISSNGYTRGAYGLVAKIKRKYNIDIHLKTAHDVEEEIYEGRALILNLYIKLNVVTADISGKHRSISKYVWVLTKEEQDQVILFVDNGPQVKTVQTKTNSLDLSTITNYKKFDKLQCIVYDSKGDRVSREMLL